MMQCHICPKCGWGYPNHHPSAKKRRAHTKVCSLLVGSKIDDVDVEETPLSVSEEVMKNTRACLIERQISCKSGDAVTDFTESDPKASNVADSIPYWRHTMNVYHLSNTDSLTASLSQVLEANDPAKLPGIKRKGTSFAYIIGDKAVFFSVDGQEAYFSEGHEHFYMLSSGKILKYEEYSCEPHEFVIVFAGDGPIVDGLLQDVQLWLDMNASVAEKMEGMGDCMVLSRDKWKQQKDNIGKVYACEVILIGECNERMTVLHLRNNGLEKKQGLHDFDISYGNVQDRRGNSQAFSYISDAIGSIQGNISYETAYSVLVDAVTIVSLYQDAVGGFIQARSVGYDESGHVGFLDESDQKYVLDTLINSYPIFENHLDNCLVVTSSNVPYIIETEKFIIEDLLRGMFEYAEYNDVMLAINEVENVTIRLIRFEDGSSAELVFEKLEKLFNIEKYDEDFEEHYLSLSIPNEDERYDITVHRPIKIMFEWIFSEWNEEEFEI